MGLIAAPWVVERCAAARDLWPGGQILAYDVAGIYSRVPKEGGVAVADTTASDLARDYSPSAIAPLIFPEGRPRGYGWFAPRKRELSRAWRVGVRQHPGAYLWHRGMYFGRLMSLDGKPSCYAFHAGIEPNPLALTLGGCRTIAFRVLRRVEEAARNTILFRGWLWAGLAVALSVAAARRGGADALPLWVAGSGSLYAVAYLLIGISCDFRFVYWTVIAVFAAAMLLFSDLTVDQNGSATR